MEVETEQKKRRGGVVTGTVGAFLGSLIGGTMEDGFSTSPPKQSSPEPTPPSAQSVGEPSGEGGGDPLQAEITEKNYQALFQPARELGYTNVGLAYYKAPQEMFERETFLDAYLPYGGEIVYTQEGAAVEATAHGMCVYQTTGFSEENAKAVVDEAYEAFVASGADLYEEEAYETQYAEEYDIAYRQAAFFEEDGTKARFTIFYADVKEGSYYLSAQITYLPEQMDGEYPAMLAELSDAFGLELPEIPAN